MGLCAVDKSLYVSHKASDISVDKNVSPTTFAVFADPQSGYGAGYATGPRAWASFCAARRVRIDRREQDTPLVEVGVQRRLDGHGKVTEAPPYREATIAEERVSRFRWAGDDVRPMAPECVQLSAICVGFEWIRTV